MDTINPNPIAKIKIYRRGKLVRRIIASRESYRRLYSRLATASAQKWVIRVDYGQGFSNEGEYFKAKEAKQALRAFLEP